MDFTNSIIEVYCNTMPLEREEEEVSSIVLCSLFACVSSHNPLFIDGEGLALSMMWLFQLIWVP